MTELFGGLLVLDMIGIAPGTAALGGGLLLIIPGVIFVIAVIGLIYNDTDRQLGRW